MTAPLWASLVLLGFGGLALAFHQLPQHRALALIVFLAALGLAGLRLFPLALPLAAFGVALWQGGIGRRAPSAARGRAAGGTSEVASAGLRMTLDRASGAMDGEVLRGAHAGRRLSQLPPEAVRELAAGFEADGDDDSLALLLAWLDRAGRRDEASAPPGTGMTPTEAYRILGLAPGASVEEVRAAYHRLMRRVHPDLGGSGALAAMLNAAKEVLDPP